MTGAMFNLEKVRFGNVGICERGKEKDESINTWLR